MPRKNHLIYDIRNIAKFFGVSAKTARDWCKRGRLPAFKIGKEWKVRASDLQKMIDRKVSIRPAGAERTPRLF